MTARRAGAAGWCGASDTQIGVEFIQRSKPSASHAASPMPPPRTARSRKPARTIADRSADRADVNPTPALGAPSPSHCDTAAALTAPQPARSVPPRHAFAGPELEPSGSESHRSRIMDIDRRRLIAVSALTGAVPAATLRHSGRRRAALHARRRRHHARRARRRRRRPEPTCCRRRSTRPRARACR